MRRNQSLQSTEVADREPRLEVRWRKNLKMTPTRARQRLLKRRNVGKNDQTGAKEMVSDTALVDDFSLSNTATTESEHETGSPTKTAPPEPEPSQASPNTPTPQEPAPVRPSTRKSGRPPARRGRVGRNQYTKDRDTNGNGDVGYMANSPRRGQSHEVGGDSPRLGYSGVNGAHVNGGESGRPSRPRHMHPHRTTMNEMKRRVAAILEFISRMQVEMAVSSENSSTPTGNGDRAQGLLLKSMVNQIENDMPSARSDGGESGPATTDGGYGESTNHERDFKELSSVEMMDVLTRHLLKWQQEFGKFGER